MKHPHSFVSPSLALLFLAEAFLLLFLFFLPSLSSVFAAAGMNVTVETRLLVGNVYPEITNLTVYGVTNGLDLVANSTALLYIEAIVTDYNGEGDLLNMTSIFFDDADADYNDANDNNNHYSNMTCLRDFSYGDAYQANFSCRILVQYYANNATWNLTVRAYDNWSLDDYESTSVTVNLLLALGVPDSIDFGTVNATFVSNENVTNVTNYGNVPLNLSIYGYATNQSDNLSMNCSLGAIKNISAEYGRYNFTESNPGAMNVTQFFTNYTAISNSSVIRRYTLAQRQDDLVNEAVNSTYWRVYVPLGVAGTCRGNVVFGATVAPES